MVSVKGLNAFTEQPKQRNQQLGSGWITTRTWLGPRALLDAFIIGTIQPLEPETIATEEGNPAIIRATFPDDITAINSDPLQSAEDNAVWELIPSPMDRPLSTHKAFNESGGTAEYMMQIDKAISDGTAFDTDWDTASTFAHMNDYRNLKVKGCDSWRTWAYTIRKTISVGRDVDVKRAETNAGAIVSYNQIGIPSTVKWAQPTYVTWDGSGGFTVVGIDYWLANPPQIRFHNKKYDIVNEWLGAYKWYAVLYAGGTAATTEDGIF